MLSSLRTEPTPSIANSCLYIVRIKMHACIGMLCVMIYWNVWLVVCSLPIWDFLISCCLELNIEHLLYVLPYFVGVIFLSKIFCLRAIFPAHKLYTVVFVGNRETERRAIYMFPCPARLSKTIAITATPATPPTHSTRPIHQPIRATQKKKEPWRKNNINSHPRKTRNWITNQSDAPKGFNSTWTHICGG